MGFLQIRNLKSHYEIFHAEHPRIRMITKRLRKDEEVCPKCKYCGGTFADEDTLKTHIQVDHENPKQFTK